MTTRLRLVERVLAVADWVAAALLVFYAGLYGLVGLVFGFWFQSERPTMNEFRVAFFYALVYLVVGGLCVAAALGMHRQARWRWWLQVSAVAAYFVLSSLIEGLRGES